MFPNNYYEMPLNIATQIFVVDLDFDRCTLHSFKCSSCVGECMHASLNHLENQLQNQLYQFKVNLFVLGTARWLTRRNKRLLAMVSLSFGIGETNCSQENNFQDHCEPWDK